MRPILQSVCAILERAEILEDEAGVRGYLGDQLVTFQLRVLDGGSVALQWTKISVPGPPGLSVKFLISPRARFEPWEVKANIVLDLQLDDPVFDAAYHIEGAPLRLIRAIVDAEVRRALVALQPDRVLTTATELVVELPGWIEDGERAALSVRTAARLGALGAEIGRREIAGVGPSDTSGYRGLVAPGTRARDLQELDALRDLAERRAKAQRKDAIRAGLYLGAFLVALGVTLWRCSE